MQPMVAFVTSICGNIIGKRRIIRGLPSRAPIGSIGAMDTLPQNAATDAQDQSAELILRDAARAARHAARGLAALPASARDAGLRQAAAALRDHEAAIQQANDRDLAVFDGTDAFRDRLTLNAARIE